MSTDSPPGGPGSDLYRPCPLGTAAPSSVKNRKIDRAGVYGDLHRIAKFINRVLFVRKTGVFPRESHRNAGSDGAIPTAAFFHGVSCQAGRGPEGFVSGGMRWKIRILAVFWPPARNSSAHGAEPQLAETQTAGRESSARINAGMTFGIMRNGIRPRKWKWRQGSVKTAELKVLPVTILKPAEYNPRKKLKPGDKEYEKIKNSIEEFGFADPLVVNADMTIIGGHQRLTVAQDLGYTEVPCAVVDVDKTREKALNIALNKITGAWDENLLADLLKDIQDSDFDLGFTGFDPPEIETLFNKVHTKDVEEDDFDVEEELAQPVFSKLGDLWQLGPHRVICGDSTGEEVYTRLMDGQKANLVLTDPPYNVDVEETAGKIMNDNMADEDFYNFLLSAYRCMHANLADDGSIYVWHADTEGLNFRKAFRDAGFYLSGCCIWKKNALVLGRSPYQWIHEPCLFGWKQTGKHQWYSDRKQVTVWEYDKPRSSKDHPTMKPVALMSYPLRNSTMTNGVVLDPFLGSGSTLIACCETDRVCRGIELDPKFVDVIVKRYQAWCQDHDTAAEIYVLRDGQKLTFEEAIAAMEG